MTNNNFIECYKSLNNAIVVLKNKQQELDELEKSKIMLLELSSKYYRYTKSAIESKLEAEWISKKGKFKQIPFYLIIATIGSTIGELIVSLIFKGDMRIANIIGTTIGMSSVNIFFLVKNYKKAKKQYLDYQKSIELIDVSEDKEIYDLYEECVIKEENIKDEINALKESIDDYKKMVKELEDGYAEDILQEYDIEVKLDLDVKYKKLDNVENKKRK